MKLITKYEWMHFKFVRTMITGLNDYHDSAGDMPRVCRVHIAGGTIVVIRSFNHGSYEFDMHPYER